MFENILVVCVGNICRSPTAELLLRHYLPELHVSSAGIGALSGKGMDKTALDVARQHGLDGRRHVARQVDNAMLHAADLILVMEHDHIDAIAKHAPQALGRVMLLGKWLQEREIPDPYRQQRAAFEHVYRLIDDAVRAWQPYLYAGE
ncbi:MAG TPA: hypothetical protein VK110_05905 [Salinisphaeraceae bacterium]|nr:hypothetical protein [Salinisphaeraceae bacterium]